MPGFWGQYGPKTRDISFLGPLHFAYDHYDYKFRSGTNYRIRPFADDLINHQYAFSNLSDAPHYDVLKRESVAIPIYLLRPGQSLVSVEIECRTISPLAKESDMGLWLFSRDFSVVWGKRLFPASLNLSSGARYEIPMDLESKTLLDATNINHNVLTDCNEVFSKYFYTDLQGNSEPPFIASTTDTPAMPDTGFYLCFCANKTYLSVKDLVLHFFVTVSASRYV